MFYCNELLNEENLEILLIELMAYSQLDGEEFSFDGESMKNTGDFRLGSEGAYLEMDIQNIQEALLYPEIVNNRKKKTNNNLNNYERKMYHKKNRHIRRIKEYVPWYLYDYDCDTDTHKYWKRNYVQSKALRLIGNNIIRSIIPGKEDFSLNGGGYKKVYDYWWDIF